MVTKKYFIADIPSKRKKDVGQNITFFSLFRFATTNETIILVIGLILSGLSGFGSPYNVVIYGEFTTLLAERILGNNGSSSRTIILEFFGGGRILTNGTHDENINAIFEDSKAFGISCAVGALAMLLLLAAGVYLVNYSAIKQITRIRKLFLKSVLIQDIAWYDTTSENFASRITDDLDKIRAGIADSLSNFLHMSMTFVFSVIVAFLYGWKLTLVILSFTPIFIISTGIVAKVQSSLTTAELKAYSGAGSIAEEVLNGIRTVISFGGESKELERYKMKLEPAIKCGQRKGCYSGIGGGITWLIIYCSYAFAFWYGMELITSDRAIGSDEYTPAVLIIVFFTVLMGAQEVGNTAPLLDDFATACGAAREIFTIIDRIPIINSCSNDGVIPNSILGDIEFMNVHFQYPSRNNVNVLQGLNLKICAGETVALVGPSGCGKSTCLQLIQRLYDPVNGSVNLDGNRIDVINTAWLRSNIAVVGQEPVLFSTSIGENIRYGSPNASQEDIEAAAKLADCHKFIIKLPNGYDTMIGERGGQISGGQKQRIAIARALIRNPKILLLDEATSALDPHSEMKVQRALDKASKGRTTIMVSHRLTTVVNADRIIYIENGRVVEDGTYKELLNLGGKFYELVHSSSTSDDTIKRRKNIRKKSLSETIISEISSMGNGYDSDSEYSESNDASRDHGNMKKDVSIWTILQMNKPENIYILIGCIGACIVGSSTPIFAIIFGDFYGVMFMPNGTEAMDATLRFSFYFIGLGIYTGIGTFLLTYMFNISGVRLTARLREMTFKAMLRQEIGWYDEAKNSVGALCARLSGDCANVQGATGARIGVILQAVSTLAIGILIAFIFSWKLTLVSIVCVPAVFFAIFFETVFESKSALNEKHALESATREAVEAIGNIRTVASLGQEPYVLERFNNEINKVEIAMHKKCRFRGFIYGIGISMPFFAYALTLWYGGKMVAWEEISFTDLIKVSEALVFGSWALGMALQFTPNMNIARVSSIRIFNLLNRKPNIMSPAQPKIPSSFEKSQSIIEFDNVDFSYPTRKNITVLDNLKLSIPRGQTVALVGPSGCGKSTCIQLLLRYYDPMAGNLEVNYIPTVDFDINILRAGFGLVSQEPILFDKTIAENISYGDNTRTFSLDEIIAAAKVANAHEFITAMPLGYETNLGTKGAQLSGGQKQRIAIARALIRDPQILLLDEATSALDNQSEQIVQAALDCARIGRTCIVIAHRLTTVYNADLICVIKSGKVIEQGTHTELIELGKEYARLHSEQILG